MNSVALCGDGKHESVLALTMYTADNAGVPPGVYTGRFVIEARRARTRAGPARDPAVPADREDPAEPIRSTPAGRQTGDALVQGLSFDYAISIEATAGAADAAAPATPDARP